MQLAATAKNYREEISTVAYHLMRTGGRAFGIFLQTIIVESSPIPIGGRFPMALGPDRHGNIRLRVHFPTFERFDLAVKSELLKHEVMHVVLGHVSSHRMHRLQDYGADVYSLACDLAVNQYIDTKLLEKAGVKPVTVEQYGFPKDMTTVWYAEALTKNDSSPGKPVVLAIDKFPEVRTLYEALAREQVVADDTPPSDVPLAPGKYPGPFEQIVMEACLPELTDIKVDALLTTCKREAELISGSSSGGCGRGWDSAEAKEFIAQIRRKPQIPWYSILRQMESKHRAERRVVTPLRPSRRHPDHFGRAKTFKLMIWWGTDVSGSMGKEQLQLVEPELKGIHNRGADIWMLQIDAELYRDSNGRAKKLYRPHIPLIEFNGRGGTDFSPFFLELEHTPRNEKPGFAVFYTDGYGCVSNYLEQQKKKLGKAAYEEWIKKTPTRTPDGVEILWILVEGTYDPERFRREIAPFGRISVLPKARKKGKSDEDE